MDYTTKELEEKFGVKIKFLHPEEEMLLTTGYYTQEEPNTIWLNKCLSGKARLATFAHEMGHKHFWDEFPMGIGEDREIKIWHECEAWKRGLPIAKELNVLETYRSYWRSDWIPLPVTSECPFPGDDKVPHVSIGKGQEYSFEEWGKLMRKYFRTGKWRGKHLGATEHIT
ncbi:hypothetical protein ES703_73319 [subsurface metagenome]